MVREGQKLNLKGNVSTFKIFFKYGDIICKKVNYRWVQRLNQAHFLLIYSIF